MRQADNVPVTAGPCPACGGSELVTIALRNTQARTDQVLTQTCLACLPAPALGTAGRPQAALPRAAGLLPFRRAAWCASGGAAFALSLWLRGTALALALARLIAAAAICLAAAVACKMAGHRVRKAVLR